MFGVPDKGAWEWAIKSALRILAAQKSKGKHCFHPETHKECVPFPTDSNGTVEICPQCLANLAWDIAWNQGG